MVELTVRRRSAASPFVVIDYTVHVCKSENHDVRIAALQQFAYVGYDASEGRIVGAAIDGSMAYHERGNVVIDHYEPVFEFLDEEVLN
ncbi:hypothetical protein C5B90_19170 [Haloferax sp. Atlit-12N]|nr:hypothetical protein C5B90_19170 [Haloferax sp. Atlit-12N]